jgi:hypothetical protein
MAFHTRTRAVLFRIFAIHGYFTAFSKGDHIPILKTEKLRPDGEKMTCINSQ